MNANSSDKPYPSFGEAIAAVHKRTTDVTKIGRAWGYTLIDWHGKLHRQIFESKRLAEWRLIEVRLCIAADILYINILDILVRVHSAQWQAFLDPLQCVGPGDWTNYVPENMIQCPPEEHFPFEGESYLRKHEALRSIFIESDDSTKRSNTIMKLRNHAISMAEERVSDIRLDADGKWSFVFMRKDGMLFTYSYDSELCAHNERVVRCLGIAANILRLDIRNRLEDFTYILMNGHYFPDETPHLGIWWKWLPYRAEVPKLPGDRDYFDMIPF